MASFLSYKENKVFWIKSLVRKIYVPFQRPSLRNIRARKLAVPMFLFTVVEEEFLCGWDWRRMSHWEKMFKNHFCVSFNLMSFLGLALDRMSPCCLVKRSLTLNWWRLQRTKTVQIQWPQFVAHLQNCTNRIIQTLPKTWPTTLTICHYLTPTTLRQQNVKILILRLAVAGAVPLKKVEEYETLYRSANCSPAGRTCARRASWPWRQSWCKVGRRLWPASPSRSVAAASHGPDSPSTTWDQCYQTFCVRNLWIFVIS